MSRPLRSYVALALFGGLVPLSLALSEVNVGDTPFTPEEIDQQMVAYSVANGQHTSIDNNTAAPRWQSFIPNNPYLLGVAWSTTGSPNGNVVPADPLRTFDAILFEGEGVGGTVLGSRTISGLYQDPVNLVVWAFHRFETPIEVTPGQTYTFRVKENPSASTPYLQWAVRVDNPYALGRADSNTAWDHTFKVASSPVPEPATLLVLGAGVIPLLRRRRRS